MLWKLSELQDGCEGETVQKLEINSTSRASMVGRRALCTFRSRSSHLLRGLAWPSCSSPEQLQLELTPLATGQDAAEGALAAAATLTVGAGVAATPIERVIKVEVV